MGTGLQSSHLSRVLENSGSWEQGDGVGDFLLLRGVFWDCWDLLGS